MAFYGSLRCLRIAEIAKQCSNSDTSVSGKITFTECLQLGKRIDSYGEVLKRK